MKKQVKKMVADDAEHDQELHRLVHWALEQDGSLIPISPEAVARVEAELESEEIDLPDTLSTFEKALERASENRRSKCLPLKLTNNVEENLARAARDGGEISPEVETRMRSDRATAESDINARKYE
jgi:hypothetical protein